MQNDVISETTASVDFDVPGDWDLICIVLSSAAEMNSSLSPLIVGDPSAPFVWLSRSGFCILFSPKSNFKYGLRQHGQLPSRSISINQLSIHFWWNAWMQVWNFDQETESLPVTYGSKQIAQVCKYLSSPKESLLDVWSILFLVSESWSSAAFSMSLVEEDDERELSSVCAVQSKSQVSFLVEAPLHLQPHTF